MKVFSTEVGLVHRNRESPVVMGGFRDDPVLSHVADLVLQSSGLEFSVPAPGLRFRSYLAFRV